MPDSTLAPGGPEGYRLLDLLGRGGFGEVWRAEAPGGVKVAVKILSLTLKPAEAKRELAALNSILELRHPYLLSLQAIFYHGDRILVVMELADGSLRSRLNSCREEGQPGIPVGELLRYARESAEAIDFLHANERLHRDIKPDNILLLAGHAKVADYGLARILEKQQTVRTQSVVGTPAYMAPETWEGTVGPRSDQYSLAVVYAELRCGHRPFEARSMPHMARLHATSDPDLGGIPEAEQPVLGQALAKKSSNRYPTCRAFVTALTRAVQAGAAAPSPAKRKALLSLLTVIALPASKPTPVKDGRRQIAPTLIESSAKPTRTAGRNWRLAWAGGLALLLAATAAGIGGWLYHAGRDDGKDSGQTIADAGTPRGNASWGGSGQGSDLGGNRVGGQVLEVEIAEKMKMTFCWIPPGKATLGSPATENDHSSNETEHEYTSRGFWLAKFPVTQEQWQALMKDNPTPSRFNLAEDEVKQAGITSTSLFPVEGVSWNDCQDFLGKMNVTARVPAGMGKGKFVLPHEDEWEYACRGGKGNQQPFYFGDRLNGDKANCDGNYPYRTETKGNYKKRTTEVGSYEQLAPHPWGLCDMHGNVYQWRDNRYKDDKDSSALRGGSWSDYATGCRAAYRRWIVPGFRYVIGFRPCFRLD